MLEGLFFFTLASVGCVVAYKVIARFGGTSRQKLLLQRAVPIRACSAERVVKLVGRVISSSSLTAPISGQRCLFYKLWIEVDETHQQVKIAPFWRPVLTRTERADHLLLQDEAGDLAKVHLGSAQIDAEALEDDNLSDGVEQLPPPEIVDLIREAGEKISPNNLRHFRWGERSFAPRGAVAVVGRVVEGYRPGSAYRDASSQVELGPISKKQPLIVTDQLAAIR